MSRPTKAPATRRGFFVNAPPWHGDADWTISGKRTRVRFSVFEWWRGVEIATRNTKTILVFFVAMKLWRGVESSTDSAISGKRTRVRFSVFAFVAWCGVGHGRRGRAPFAGSGQAGIGTAPAKYERIEKRTPRGKGSCLGSRGFLLFSADLPQGGRGGGKVNRNFAQLADLARAGAGKWHNRGSFQHGFRTRNARCKHNFFSSNDETPPPDRSLFAFHSGPPPGAASLAFLKNERAFAFRFLRLPPSRRPRCSPPNPASRPRRP